MKVPTLLRPQRGFTLIELLVVIAIIMVLAAAGFAVGSAALNRARKLKAQNAATAVDQAVNAFYSEYGGFPTDGDSSTINTGTPAGAILLNILLGGDDATSRQYNPRGMSFLAIKEGKRQGTGGMDGVVFDASGTALGLYDPWGNPYTVEMDTEFNDYLEFTPAGIDGATEVRLNRRRVAVYSPGVPVGDTASMKTMVKTW
jgi:prepilin-type N-terminal cleavage/methylation domain-containing protein